jgi:hypothetical protein
LATVAAIVEAIARRRFARVQDKRLTHGPIIAKKPICSVPISQLKWMELNIWHPYDDVISPPGEAPDAL